MRGPQKVCVLLFVLVPVWLGGCTPAGSATVGEVTVNLKVPPSKTYKKHHNRVRDYQLTIDGTDYSEPKETSRTIQVPLKEGQDKITIKYSFWTNNYTNFVRTKIVPVEKGKTYDVDMTQEDTDPDNKDHVEPVWIATPNDIAEEMCKVANVTGDDEVWDIGCGDGVMVFAAVKKFGAKKGVGIDINPDLIATCKSNAKKDGVADRVEFKVGDALKIKDASDATVVLLYVGDDLGVRLRPVLQDTLKPGARVVSHRFKLGDWEPDQTVTVKGKDGDDYHLHLWTVKDKGGQ